MGSVDDNSQRLRNAAQDLELDITQTHVDQLLDYVAQIERWNRHYNLTALKEADQMLVQHIFDSMAVIPTLDAILYKNTVHGASVADIGSGAGLPGIVLAVLRPTWQVHCVDAVEKKTAFMRQMIGTLGLTNLRVTHTRIEALAPQQADIVISRAFASLQDFATLAGSHAAPSGLLVAMKGRHPDDEIADLVQHTDWRVGQSVQLTVPELDAQRCLLTLYRQGK